MRRPDDEMIQSMCRFLAMDEPDKLKFLPPIQKGKEYMINDAGHTHENPAVYYCNAIYELTCWYPAGKQDEFSTTMADINSLLDLLVGALRETEPMFYLDKQKYPVTASSMDRIWNILRLLAQRALAARGWEPGVPSISFHETDRMGGRIPIK